MAMLDDLSRVARLQHRSQQFFFVDRLADEGRLRPAAELVSVIPGGVDEGDFTGDQGMDELGAVLLAKPDVHGHEVNSAPSNPGASGGAVADRLDALAAEASQNVLEIGGNEVIVLDDERNGDVREVPHRQSPRRSRSSIGMAQAEQEHPIDWVNMNDGQRVPGQSVNGTPSR